MSSDDDATSPTWRELAVARSLDPARVRAENRVQRFIDAAFDLLSDSEPGKDFTVQDVVEKSGQSLRSFYQYFGGKQELLLALFEESVRTTAETIEDALDELDDPLERLHRFVLEYYRLCLPSPKGRKAGKKPPTRALAEFAQQLLTAQPAAAARAFAPLVELFEEVLDGAIAGGAVRDDLPRRRAAGVVLEAIMFNAFSTTIGGSVRESTGGDPAEELWELLLHGIGS